MESTHSTKTLSRRGLLAGAAGGTAAAAVTPALAQAMRARKAQGRRELLVPQQNIGIQLYTVRDLADADLPGLLATLASIGYTEVEPFSYHGRTPAQFKQLLDANGLRAIGFHIGADRFRNELNTVLNEAQLLG